MLNVKSLTHYAERQAEVISLIQKVYYPDLNVGGWSKDLSKELKQLLDSKKIEVLSLEPRADEYKILMLVESSLNKQLVEKHVSIN
jgi:predicted amino acid racemase